MWKPAPAPWCRPSTLPRGAPDECCCFPVFDATVCELGEGPLWHPLRRQLFWFDILNKSLLTQENDHTRIYRFETLVSAAGWVDERKLLIASDRELFSFDVETGAARTLCALEADNPATRSNDGRADPYGGFWIGTMGKNAEKDAGAIYRWYRGELRKLFAPITISNSIAFAPDGETAFFSDTVTGRVMRVALDDSGWPKGEPEVFLDLTSESRNPDGAVVDESGLLWLAEWGSSRVAAYAPDGSFVRDIAFDAPTPAARPLAATTLAPSSAPAPVRASAPVPAAKPLSGMTFAAASGRAARKSTE
ncbi:SMP-30/gluconolactonase/LRE family protein [Pannonibacter sp. Pt2-lr]